MKQVINDAMPSAAIAINKSRIKLYDKKSDTPTYYLKKGSEFQIELFNPTKDIILAKIHLNNKSISQGGLVLKPGERVFLDRYIDVSKKFLFDTYEVTNTNEVKEAIKENGDFKVDFYKERKPFYQPHYNIPDWSYKPQVFGPASGYPIDIRYGTTTGVLNMDCTTTMNLTNCSNTIGGSATLDSLEDFQVNSVLRSKTSNVPTPKKKSKKSIETGRVEVGSESDQKLTEVSYDFEYFSFHTVEYKLLPISQKVNTIREVKIKRYCCECGAKQKPTNKFCPSCGTKQ